MHTPREGRSDLTLPTFHDGARTNATNRRVRELISAVKKGNLIPKPEFQRRLVWANKDRVSFLETVLMNLPFPEIYVCAGEVNTETAEGTELLVDGQQRVTALIDYFDASEALKLGDMIPSYNDLKEDRRRAFLDYQVVVRDLGDIPTALVREVFQRINLTRYGLNAMELANARYDGAIKKFADRIAEHDFYSSHVVFRASDIKRMGDTSFQLSLIVTMHTGYFDDSKLHAQYLERYNDEFELADEYEKRLTGVFKFIDGLDLANKSRWWKKADLFSLIIELDRCFESGVKLSAAKLKKLLVQFEDDAKGVKQFNTSKSLADKRQSAIADYLYAAAQGSNHRKSRISRGTVIKTWLIDKAIEKEATSA